MVTVRTLLLFSCLLVLPTAAQESDYAWRIKEARAKVAAAEKEVKEKEREYGRKATAVNAAYTKFAAARNARVAHYRDLKALKNSTEALDGKIEDCESQLRVLARFVKRERDPEKLASYKREIKAWEFALKQYKLRKQRILDRRGITKRLKDLNDSTKKIEDAYWEAMRVHRHALSDAELAAGVVRFREELLAEKRVALANLRIEAFEKFKDAAPAYLKKVQAKAGEDAKYVAEWKSLEQLTDEKIALMREAIKDQRQQIKRQKLARDEAESNFSAAGDKSVRLIEQYREEIYDQAYRAIGIELVNSAINIADDYKKLGPYAFLTEAGGKIYDAVTGDLSGAYSFPTTSGSGPSDSMNQLFTWQNQREVAKSTGISNIYGVIKTAVEASLGGNVQHVIDDPDVASRGIRGARKKLNAGELWIIPKEKLMFGASNAPYRIRTIDRKSIRQGLINTFRRRSFREVSKGLMEHTKKVWREFDWGGAGKGVLTGVAQGMIKNEVLELNKLPRLRAFQRVMEADTDYREYLSQYRLQSEMYRVEQRQLAAYQKYLDELLDARENIANEQRLIFERDDVVEGKEVKLFLDFTRPVETISVLLGDQAATGEVLGNRWTATVPLAGQPGPLARLTVNAQTVTTQQKLDSNPRTVPVKTTGRNVTWRGFEPGPDVNHRIKLKPVPDGLSTLILVDCSGSMEGKRMQNAKAAVKQLMTSGALGENDEVTLWRFYYGGSAAVENVVPFTADRKRVSTAAQSLGVGGGTPLAAAILRAGRYLQVYAQNRRRIMIILSDGEETCNGNPAAAIEAVRQLGTKVRMGR